MENLVGLISYLKSKEEHIAIYELLTALERHAYNLEEFDLLGKLYSENKLYYDALRVTLKVLDLVKNYTQEHAARCNLIKTYNEINQPDKALTQIELIEEKYVYSENIEMEKVFSYYLLNQKDKAKEILEKLLVSTKDELLLKKVKFNLGTYYLEDGKFQDGLRGFILTGKEIGIWPNSNVPDIKKLKLSDDIHKVDKLLVMADGGIGDELINIRFMKELPNATWYTTRKDLYELFKYNGYNVTNNYEPYNYDKITGSMELPIYLNTQPEEVWKGQYLEPTKKSLDKFNYLKNGKIKIGLRWSGNPMYDQNLHRSIDLSDVYKIVKELYPVAELYSLQYPPEPEKLKHFPDIIDIADKITSFDDTLAIISNLDIVITSCTSIAHAAAILCVKTYVFVPIAAYYTWVSKKDDGSSIWYGGNVKVLNKVKHNTWEEPLNDLKTHLNIISFYLEDPIINYKIIACGDQHTMAIKTDGTLWSWGDNGVGQLGLGDTNSRSSPVQVGSLSDWKSIACNYYHIMAVKTDGTLWSWGFNGSGQLGLGDAISKSSPVQVGSLSDWKSISCGGMHTIAIKTDGTLWSWGNNSYGQLGLGDTISRSSPVQVGSLSDWKSISCGGHHTMAIKTDGTLWAWGDNDYGQLGLGGVINKLSPVQVGSLSDWYSVVSRSHHTLAIKNDGTLWSWGDNGVGQLGLGDRVNLSSPLQVGSLIDWKTIYAGQHYTVAIKTDGTLWAWGQNKYGQLGLGDRVNISSPVQVGSLSDWKTIACGYGHTVAIKANGALWSRGSNNCGQLGIGNVVNKT